jgi:hypothetical protein
MKYNSLALVRYSFHSSSTHFRAGNLLRLHCLSREAVAYQRAFPPPILYVAPHFQSTLTSFPTQSTSGQNSALIRQYEVITHLSTSLDSQTHLFTAASRLRTGVNIRRNTPPTSTSASADGQDANQDDRAHNLHSNRTQTRLLSNNKQSPPRNKPKSNKPSHRKHLRWPINILAK